jgi:hypothetical protein
LPDDLYQALKRYADERQQSPEEALAALLQGAQSAPGSATPAGTAPIDEHPLQIIKAASEDTSEFLDPWEGFRGKFEAKYPDLIQRHDYSIGQAALETHEDEDQIRRRSQVEIVHIDEQTWTKPG